MKTIWLVAVTLLIILGVWGCYHLDLTGYPCQKHADCASLLCLPKGDGTLSCQTDTEKTNAPDAGTTDS